MPRLNLKRYQQQMMLAMSVYIAVMLFVWPLVRTVRGLPLKTVIALTPLLPMLYVIALIAKRIRDSDELEQRTHLIGLGVATAVAGMLSLAGGFLASAQVLAVDGSILIWVFPVMLACYGVTRWWVARPYSDHLGCDPEDALALHWRMAIPVFLSLFVVLVAYLKYATLHPRVLTGAAAFSGMIVLASGVIYWRRRRRDAVRRAGEHVR